MAELLQIAQQPFEFDFMRNAVMITLIVAIPAALLSCFLVLKGWSLMGDAISHAVLPGIVLAYIFSIPLTIGAFIAGMICALSTGYLSANSRVKEDTIMGVVFSGMFALGLVLYTSIETELHLDQILFGDMLGVLSSDIQAAAIIAAIVTTILVFRWKDFLLHTFDSQQARAAGLPVKLMHYALLAMLSLTIVAALKSVGLILAIALFISPGAIAFLFVKRFGQMMVVATLVCVISSFIGIYLSFFIDSAPAPTIVLVMATIFVIAFLYRTWLNAGKTQNAN